MTTLPKAILSRAKGLPCGPVLSPKQFLHLGNRTAVDQAFSRLARDGQLVRVDRGVYMLASQPGARRSQPATSAVVAALAAHSGDVVVPDGAASAISLGLVERARQRPGYLTSGKTRTLVLEQETVVLRHAPAWMFAMADEPAGAAVRALGWIGQAGAPKALSRLRLALCVRDWSRLVSCRASLPSWMARAIAIEASIAPPGLPKASRALADQPAIRRHATHTQRSNQCKMSTYKFVDLFSGCGGLSLGLAMAGLQGQFAVEKDAMAFETFAANFLGKRRLPVEGFAWPVWLEQRAWPVDELLAEHGDDLHRLEGVVEVMAGGPPCQGFSFAGRRNEADPRNLLFEKYVEAVRAIRPSALVVENVPGMKVAHSRNGLGSTRGTAPAESYYEKLKRSLEDVGYQVHGELVDASRFGVPQRRTRLIVIGLRNDVAASLAGGVAHAFQELERMRVQQLDDLGLPEAVTACDALSDLATKRSLTKQCADPRSPKGFIEIEYREPLTPYQKLMHKGCPQDAMDSMRLARHGDAVRERFARIIEECPQGVRMNDTNREQYSTKKHRIFPMAALEPAPTITTLPDDVLHYDEPRILTVRESARLQSFPDWFQFRGKFTTGGHRRMRECPRYTQVGNAVPPLLARAIGLAIRSTLDTSRARGGAQGLRDTREPVAMGDELALA